MEGMKGYTWANGLLLTLIIWLGRLGDAHLGVGVLLLQLEYCCVELSGIFLRYRPM